MTKSWSVLTASHGDECQAGERECGGREPARSGGKSMLRNRMANGCACVRDG